MICDDKKIVDNILQINNINLSYNDNTIFKNFSIGLHINKINIILGSSVTLKLKIKPKNGNWA